MQGYIQNNQQALYAQQVNAMNANQAALTGDTATPSTVMGAAMMELDCLIERAQINTARMREINNRLFGAVPEKAQGTAPRPVANGSVQVMGEKVEALKTLLCDQSMIIDQLNKIG